MIWYYKRFFNYYSNKVITLMFNTCEWFYLQQTTNLKQKTAMLFINQMVFIIRIVFVRNVQNIYLILVEWESLF